MKTLVFVEDDADIREYIPELLAIDLPDTNVKAFADPRIACEYMAENKVDGVLSDLNMPIIDGVDFNEMLAQKDMLVHPFVFFTGFTSYRSDVVDRMRASGRVDAVILKPNNGRIARFFRGWFNKHHAS